MNQIKVKLLPHNPNAAYLTSRGWVYPDGTFKPHYAVKPILPMPKRKWWQL